MTAGSTVFDVARPSAPEPAPVTRTWGVASLRRDLDQLPDFWPRRGGETGRKRDLRPDRMSHNTIAAVIASFIGVAATVMTCIGIRDPQCKHGAEQQVPSASHNPEKQPNIQEGT